MDQECRSICTTGDQKRLKEKDSNLSAPRSETSALKTVLNLGFFSDLQNSQCRSNLNIEKTPLRERQSDQFCQQGDDQCLNSGLKLDVGLKGSSNLKANRKNKNRKKDACLEILTFTYIQYLRERGSSLYPERFRQFLLRRNCQCWKELGKRLDLGVCSLVEVVALTKQKGLISRNLYNSFELSCFHDIETIFIQKIKNKSLQFFNFSKYHFTPFDHRMLAETLTNLYPLEFTYPSHPIVFDPNTTIFYQYLYSLPSGQYWAIFDLLNEKFQRAWMPQQRGFCQSFVQDRKVQKNSTEPEVSYLFDKSERKLRKKT